MDGVNNGSQRLLDGPSRVTLAVTEARVVAHLTEADMIR